LIGWVANSVSPNMDKSEDNLRALKQRINAPLLGHIPYLTTASYVDAASYL
jgi:dethiobiotin synthetase